jgi:hypothetical protein
MRREFVSWQPEKPRRDKKGKRWNFSYQLWVWTDQRVQHAQRLFFWDDEHIEYGVVLFPVGRSVHYSKIKDLIDNLVADPSRRIKYQRDLRFPLERHYSDYGVFHEEAGTLIAG